MLRSHRLLRDVHRRRLERAAYAENPRHFKALEELHAFGKTMRAIEGDAYLDVTRLDEPSTVGARAVGLHAGRTFSDGVVSGLAAVALARVVGERADRFRLGGQDRWIANAASALAQAAVLDRVVRASEQVLRRRALVDHRRTPHWPARYVERDRAAAEAVGQGDLIGGGAGEAVP